MLETTGSPGRMSAVLAAEAAPLALLALVGAPAVLLIDAATFVVSFVLVVGFVPPARAAVEEAEPASLARGLHLLRTDAVLRPITAAQFLSQAAFMAMNAAVPVLAFTAYDRDPALAGAMLGVWGGGAMAGGVVAFRLVGRHDPVRWRRWRGRCRRRRCGRSSRRHRGRSPSARSRCRGWATGSACRR
ncbi:MAG TPA: hypothetical protein VHF51_17565 [Solirubrobacteraceae bacterium]|nr:hypothetical protein [Solirubrobacteraceae bacterium]